MKNPSGEDKKEPSLGNETDKERIARLEKEVEDLKNNQKKSQYEKELERLNKEKQKEGKSTKPKKSMGCMTIIGIFLLIGYLATFFDSDNKSTKSSSTTTTKVEFKDDAENRDRKYKLTKRFRDGDIIAPSWSADGKTFTIYMKNPNTAGAFAKAVCQIARDDYFIKYNFNIQIGKLPSYKKVGSLYVCPRKVGFN